LKNDFAAVRMAFLLREGNVFFKELEKTEIVSFHLSRNSCSSLAP